MLARTGIATSLILLMTSASAFAVDAQAFGARLKAAAAAQSVPFAYDSAEANGDNVVLKGVSLQPDGGDKIGQITFEGVTGSDAEGWQVARIPIEDLDETQGDSRVRLSGLQVEGLRIAGTGQTQSIPALAYSGFYFDSAEFSQASVERGGKPLLEIKDAAITNALGDGQSLTSDFSVASFDIDLTADPNAEGARTIREIGYDTISGKAGGKASWEPQTGRLALQPFSVDVSDVGSLSFTYALSGYTPAFMDSLRQIQQQMATNPENNQAAGMAMLGLISQLFVNSADITFTDESVTNKLLDYYAKRNNQSREQLIDGLMGALPAALNYIQNPDFQAKVSSAIETFLKDPQKLSISVEPQNPVAATQIIGAAMGAPQTLPAVLSLDVTAND